MPHRSSEDSMHTPHQMMRTFSSGAHSSAESSSPPPANKQEVPRRNDASRQNVSRWRVAVGGTGVPSEGRVSRTTTACLDSKLRAMPLLSCTWPVHTLGPEAIELCGMLDSTSSFWTTSLRTSRQEKLETMPQPKFGKHGLPGDTSSTKSSH